MATGLTFRLFGEDVSASSALDQVGIKASDIAKGAAAAFTGLKLTDAFTSGLDNEKVLDKFAAGFGGVGPISEKAGQTASSLFAAGFGESQADVVGAVNAIGSQMVNLGDVSQEELDRITRGALSVGETFDVDVAQVARAAGQMMKNGMAPDAQTAMDIIAGGMANGANAGGDFLDVLSEYGDSFRNVGVDGQMATAMISSGMANGAFSADIAADAVREFGTRVLDGSAAAAGAFGSLGLNADEMTAKIAAGGPQAQEAMGQIMTALSNTTDPLARETAGVALFGGMWEDAGASMILSMNPATQAITDVTGAAQEMGDTLKDNAATKVEQANRGLDTFLQTALTLPGPMGDVVAIGAAMGPQAIAMGASFVTMGGAVKGMLPSMTQLKTAFGAINTVMRANPIILVVSIIALLVGAFITLWNTSEGFRNFFIGMWQNIQQVVSVVWGAISAAFSTSLTFISELWTSVWGGISDFFQAIWAIITAVFQGYIMFWYVVLTGLFDFFQAIWTGVASFVTGVWNGIVSTARTIWNAVAGAITGALSGAWNWIQGVWSGIGTWFYNLWVGVVNGISTVLGTVGNIFRTVFNGVVNVVKTPFNWIIDAINFIIRGINRINFSVPSWVPLIGGNSVGFNIGQIPRLAEGGIAMPRSGGSMFIAGEAGEPEAIVPLSKWDSMASGGDGGGGITVVLPQNVMMVGTAAELGRQIAAALSAAGRSGQIPAGITTGTRR